MRTILYAEKQVKTKQNKTKTKQNKNKSPGPVFSILGVRQAGDRSPSAAPQTSAA
jgi:hypothetical protein